MNTTTSGAEYYYGVDCYNGSDFYYNADYYNGSDYYYGMDLEGYISRKQDKSKAALLYQPAANN
ncbi:hypothetical protein DPMN_184241 [Dreissena polymorpha]|uniref:Uncharacterized protein n=1 Tax=Dreissena polymorpha TaxID=45954 RepID=A0A9D4DJ57_DREPO|nr:hypothetical protein DPMN_184241 [Dreissena polymorpha]